MVIKQKKRRSCEEDWNEWRAFVWFCTGGGGGGGLDFKGKEKEKESWRDKKIVENREQRGRSTQTRPDQIRSVQFRVEGSGGGDEDEDEDGEGEDQ